MPSFSYPQISELFTSNGTCDNKVALRETPCPKVDEINKKAEKNINKIDLKDMYFDFMEQIYKFY